VTKRSILNGEMPLPLNHRWYVTFAPHRQKQRAAKVSSRDSSNIESWGLRDARCVDACLYMYEMYPVVF